MDVKKIGEFLAQLRKDQALTQEQLGERLGVTNKTVSRWENGNYLPPVEMLQSLSEFYGISINEILSAQRLCETAYREKAEENIKSVLKASTFTLKDRIAFFKKKWIKEHIFTTVLGWIIILGAMIAGSILYNGLQLIAIIAGFAFILLRRNQMMSYIEDRAFDGSGTQ